MSYDPNQSAPAPQHLPPAQVPQTPPPSRGGFPVLGCFFAVSFVANLFLGVLLFIACAGLLVRGTGDSSSSASVSEKHHSGKKTAKDKVAILTLDGAIMDGLHSQLEKEIDRATEDSDVKAVVFRINSPGGSITASDDIHRRLIKLRDGNKESDRPAKPLIVSMGGVAASGGYYVAMPGQYIFAEPSTITGSIGVYASFPNLAKFPEKYGVDFKTIKAGDLKAIGAMFREMTPDEEQVIQDMVDNAYVQFLDVIETGRPKLTRQVMLERFQVQPTNPDPKANGRAAKPYTRYRADGAIFTATRAAELGLIDKVGSLDDAIAYAAGQANLTDFKAVKYKKLPLLAELLLNTRSPEPPQWSLGSLQPLLTPRLWYLTPGYEAAIRLSEAGQ